MYMFFWFFKQLYYCLKRIFKSGIILLLIFFIAFLFLFGSKVFAFTPQEEQEINDMVTSMVNTSTSHKTDNMDLSMTNNKMFMYCNGTYNNTTVNYIGIGSWNSQFQYYLNDTNFVGKCVWSGSHDCLIYFYDINLNYVGSYREAIYNQNYFYINNLNILGYFYSQSTVRDFTTNNTINATFPSFDIDPYIENASTDIIGWSFNNLVINTGSYSEANAYFLRYTYPNNNTAYDFEVTNYYNNGEITIPKNVLNDDIIIRSGSTFTFTLTVRQPSMQTFVFGLGSYTLDLTEQEQEEINQDSDKQLLSSINSNQEETNEKLDEIKDTITDSSVDNDSIFLPSDSSNDITADGLNGIFTSIYNAFCTGTAQDIVFPIPFTSKNITLQADYVRTMLSNNGATWIITIIEAFWWYLISKFIIKDITNKITKIKSGNIEDIEETNIKGDML